MTPTYSTTGRQRRVFVPPPYVTPPAESVPLAPPPTQDPPIYRDLMRTWADRGRTLPGHHDPEWVRLAAPQVARGQFSGSRDPLGDGR
ncbi:hypothetical protein N4G65_21260 [Streptomyces fulvoviolaceus]|nr:hypothetical protein [Streptomyces fulvoviolaceus]MCT9079064.1 hypothetical protein [Streptomyces fulvoviolaceus]